MATYILHVEPPATVALGGITTVDPDGGTKTCFPTITIGVLRFYVAD